MFFLGVCQANFLHTPPYHPPHIPAHVPLMIARRHLADRRTLPDTTLRAPWVLDSGGFNDITNHGQHRTSPAAYIQEIARFRQEMPGLLWAAPQDWMCEPPALRKTGLTPLQHQHLTCQNFLELRSLAPDLPIIPVLQGTTPLEYLHHIEMYGKYGVDLDPDTPLIGIGSVCRLQSTAAILDVIRPLHSLGLRMHGFGMKTQGLQHAAPLLISADSAAWSRAGRFDGHYPRCSRPHSQNGRPFLPQNCPGCAYLFYTQLEHHFPDSPPHPPIPAPAPPTATPTNYDTISPWPPPSPASRRSAPTPEAPLRTGPAVTAATPSSPRLNGTPTSPARTAPTPIRILTPTTPQPAL